MPKYDANEPIEPPHPAQSAFPPWWSEEEKAAYQRKQLGEQLVERKKKDKPFTDLQRARQKVEQLATAVRTNAFNEWVDCCTAPAKTPDEWTLARELYASYLRHAQAHGRNRMQRGLSQEVLATETAWGRMMGTMFPKTRRTHGVYYPLRIKRGA